mmetsp:Transcript_11512/g.37644  ORF Transcript_11512/g.37644 Transcript_11512/m.37644 type:complete len:261 (+) Transcript_11512:102-884(+)
MHMTDCIDYRSRGPSLRGPWLAGGQQSGGQRQHSAQTTSAASHSTHSGAADARVLTCCPPSPLSAHPPPLLHTLDSNTSGGRARGGAQWTVTWLRLTDTSPSRPRIASASRSTVMETSTPVSSCADCCSSCSEMVCADMARKRSLSAAASIFAALRSAAERPVAMRSMSMVPVVGSIAADCIDVFISRSASRTSSATTVECSRMRACASERRTRPSSWRGVAEMTFLLPDMLRIAKYARISSCAASSEIFGCTSRRAYEM